MIREEATSRPIRGKLENRANIQVPKGIDRFGVYFSQLRVVIRHRTYRAHVRERLPVSAAEGGILFVGFDWHGDAGEQGKLEPEES